MKTYWTRLSGADVASSEVIDVGKRDDPIFWPDDAHLPRLFVRLEPGDVAVINASQSGLRLSVEFHPTKNGDLTAETLLAGTREKLW